MEKQSIEQAAKEYAVNKYMKRNGIIHCNIPTISPQIVEDFMSGANFRQPEIDELKEKLERATKALEEINKCWDAPKTYYNSRMYYIVYNYVKPALNFIGATLNNN